MNLTFAVVFLICLSSLCNAAPLMAAPANEHTAPASAQHKVAPVKRTLRDKKTTATKKHLSVSNKSKSLRDVVKAKLPPARLDLSLPVEMVRHLQPLGSLPQPTDVPLLPPMFGDKPTDSSAFEINGRLLSNEMKLQLRNTERREVEGAALDFEFKQ